VLARFSAGEREAIDRAVAEAAEAIFAWLHDGDIEACMTRFHSRWNQGESRDRESAPGPHDKKE
jgi:hypothetical protein